MALKAFKIEVKAFLLITIMITSVSPNNLTILNKDKMHYSKDKLDDLRVLSELPLSKLLRVKNSMYDFIENQLDMDYYSEAKENTSPEALAYNSDYDDFLRRTDFSNKKGKGGKINTLFMLAVTSLAFLAFGGYLLCLIVQAIKAKGNNGVDQVMAGNQPVVVMAGSVKKKKPQFNYGRRKKRDVWDNPDPDEMYNGLIMMAEGFAAWNKV